MPVGFFFPSHCLKDTLNTQLSFQLVFFTSSVSSLKVQTGLAAGTEALISFLKINIQYALSALSNRFCSCSLALLVMRDTG